MAFYRCGSSGGSEVNAELGSFGFVRGSVGSFSACYTWYHGTLSSGTSTISSDGMQLRWSNPRWTITFLEGGTYVMFGSGITAGVYEQAEGSTFTFSVSGSYGAVVARIDDSLIG